jgi:hypothetical protein
MPAWSWVAQSSAHVWSVQVSRQSSKAVQLASFVHASSAEAQTVFSAQAVQVLQSLDASQLELPLDDDDVAATVVVVVPDVNPDEELELDPVVAGPVVVVVVGSPPAPVAVVAAV